MNEHFIRLDEFWRQYDSGRVHEYEPVRGDKRFAEIVFLLIMVAGSLIGGTLTLMFFFGPGG